jgi:hypothetical protein
MHLLPSPSTQCTQHATALPTTPQHATAAFCGAQAPQQLCGAQTPQQLLLLLLLVLLLLLLQ